MDEWRETVDVLTNSTEPRRRSLRAWVAGAVTVLVALAFLALWLWDQGREARAIRDLPRAERAALYQRTLEDLTALCRDAQGDLDHCTRQARFILLFSECDAACQRLANRQLAPTR